MKSRQILESIAIISSISFVFFINQIGLRDYTSFLLAFLIIFFAIYIGIKKRSKSASDLFSANPIELFGVITIVLLIINLTNGLSSPLFFFLYFILFLLAFLNEPTSIWVFLLMLIFFFLPDASKNLALDTFIKIGSLILIAPIAFFIGKEFERRQLLSKKIESKTEEIIQDAQALKENEKFRQPDEEETIDEIIEEAESLKNDASE